jgi:hypothetical protein
MQRGFERATLQRGKAALYELAALKGQVKRQRSKDERKRRRGHPGSQKVTDASIKSAWRSSTNEPSRNRVAATQKKLELDGVTISKQALRKRLNRLGLLEKTT